jgi:flavodoxin
MKERLFDYLCTYSNHNQDFLSLVDQGNTEAAAERIVDAITYERLMAVSKLGENQDWQDKALDMAIVVSTTPMPKSASEAINSEVNKRLLEVYARLGKQS